MTYEGPHTEDQCDKCGKNIGKTNLLKVPFLYLDCNDKKHPDMSYLYYPENYGYRQYYVCKNCFKNVKLSLTRDQNGNVKRRDIPNSKRVSLSEKYNITEME